MMKRMVLIGPTVQIVITNLSMIRIVEYLKPCHLPYKYFCSIGFFQCSIICNLSMKLSVMLVPFRRCMFSHLLFTHCHCWKHQSVGALCAVPKLGQLKPIFHQRHFFTVCEKCYLKAHPHRWKSLQKVIRNVMRFETQKEHLPKNCLCLQINKVNMLPCFSAEHFAFCLLLLPWEKSKTVIKKS